MEGGDLRMSAVENRVVNMQFNNAQFEAGVAQTLRSLEALNKGLKLTEATKGLQGLGAASKNVDLSHVEKGVDSIASKFKAMSVVGITALASIAHQALATGTQLVKSLTIDPIQTGFKEYETNLNSIQTVLANTSKAGTTLRDVNKALAELNEYSDQTIYNFSEMAKNIGTFTAAGVKLETATAAIKGIANLAALSGANSEQASRAMYQLSQAISAGKVSLEDWNSVVQAGMGGKVFQEALMETARVHGVAIDKMVKDAGSFRLTLQEGWLTGEILTETLMKFTGDLNAAQLKTMGYTDKQIVEIMKLASIARAAATEVKTASQLINTLQEAVGSGWARTWELIFGDFDEAKKLWTGVNNVLGDFIKNSADARNKVIKDWKDMGGRTALIEAIGNAFKALIAVAKPIRDAFREIFPATTGRDLYNITIAILNFTKGLTISGETADKIRRTFAGLFAILGIGWDLIKEGVAFLFRLFGVITEGSGSILDVTANFGDFVVGLRKAIKEGKGIQKFFQGLQDFLEPPIRLLKSFASFLGGLFDGFDGNKAAKSVTGVVGALEPIGSFAELLLKIWQKTFGVLDDVFTNFYGFANKVVTFLSGIGTEVSSSLGGIDLQGIMGIFTTGAFAAFILTLRGMAQNVGGIFDSITDSLGAMQNTLRAATLLQIALAIGILAGAVVLLSDIDTASLTRSLSAITVMFTQLLAAMLIFEKISGFKGFAKMPFVAASMILLGVAINVLALAVKQLADLDWEELGRGLTGVTALLAAVIATAKLMPNPAGMITTAAALVILSAAIKILASAVMDLSGLSWEEMAKGLISVGALLGALTLFTMFAKANATGVLSGAGIVLLAAGIKILASAVKDMAEMSWSEIGRGMTVLAGGLAAMGLALALVPPTAPIVAAGFLILAPALLIIGDAIKQMSQLSWAEIGRGMTVLAGALTAIGLALALVPPTAPLVAAGFLILAPALLIIGDAIAQMAKLGWEEIAKGLVTLAGALLIIGVAVTAMSGAVAGAAAMLIVAAALAILTPILMVFSQMSWEEMGKGLLMLAGVFVVLGVAGLVLAAIVPSLIGLGIAITLLGVGVLAAGAGVFFFATALTALAAAGAAGTLALVAMVGALAGLIPEVMKQIGLGIVAFATAVAQASPAMVAAIVAILMALLKAIDELAPKIIDTIYKLLTALFQTILKYMPNLVDAGLRIVIAFINGVASKIGAVIDAATNLAINFIQGLQRNIPKLIQAGVDYILSFLNAIANAIRANSAKVGEAGVNIGTAIIEGMIRGLGAGLAKLVSKAADVAKSALNAAKRALGISSPSKEFMEVGRYSDEGFAKGLQVYSKVVDKEAQGVGEGAIDTLKKTMSKMNVSGDIDSRPVIRPVLDLTDVKTGTSQMSKIFAARPLVATASYVGAVNASAGYRGNQPVQPDDKVATRPAVSFTQNNYSPKALNSAEIYRQTNNQLSKAKEALPT